MTSGTYKISFILIFPETRMLDPKETLSRALQNRNVSSQVTPSIYWSYHLSSYTRSRCGGFFFSHQEVAIDHWWNIASRESTGCYGNCYVALHWSDAILKNLSLFWFFNSAMCYQKKWLIIWRTLLMSFLRMRIFNNKSQV